MDKIIFKNGYTISNTFDNEKHFVATVKAIQAFNNNSEDHSERTVEDITNTYSTLDYDLISPSDHLRIGRAISFMYSKGYFPNLARGKEKGVTKTYKHKQ